jgi:prepilin-type N-terminal cleavage/methylation domain-containing protein
MLSLSSRRRRAFTWVELIVVLAILAILLRILLPMHGHLVCGSARMACSNNLRQIGLAVHNYYDIGGAPPRATDSRRPSVLPSGTIPHPDFAPAERFSWFASLLPFLEQDSLYKQLDLSVPWNVERNRQPVEQVVRTFICPADPPWAPPAAGALTHYVGVAGVGPDAATLPAADPRAGLFGYDRAISFKDIKDGTSNTLMALETAKDNGPWAEGGTATVRGLDPTTRPYLGQGRPFGIRHTPSSRQEGANALMADASTRYLNGQISAATLEALATIAGGEQIAPDF